MKKILIFFFFIFLLTDCFNAVANNSSRSNPVISENNPVVPFTATELVNMSIRDAEKLAGRKFRLKEKIAFKLLHNKAKKEIGKAYKADYPKRSKTAFLLSILSLVTVILIPVSVTLAVISIILAAKSLKENNEDKKAKTAMGLSILSLGIIVVGLMIYGIFVSDGAFKLFTIG